MLLCNSRICRLIGLFVGFLTTILHCDKHWNGNWVAGDHEKNKDLYEPLCLAVEVNLSLNITREEYIRKYDEWRGRYEAFSWLFKQKFVQYNETTNRMSASDATGKTLVEIKPKVAVYIDQGEQSWWSMKRLFQPPHEILPYSVITNQGTTNNVADESENEATSSRYMIQIDDSDDDSYHSDEI